MKKSQSSLSYGGLFLAPKEPCLAQFLRAWDVGGPLIFQAGGHTHQASHSPIDRPVYTRSFHALLTSLMDRAARACLSGSLGHGACPTWLTVGTSTMLGGVLKETLRRDISKVIERKNGTSGRDCPQLHQGACGKSPTRWGCTERDLAAGDVVRDSGPGHKRGDKVSRQEENGYPCLGVISWD